MTDLLTPPLAPLLLVFSLCVVFAAGMVRGFAGFGFSAVTGAGGWRGGCAPGGGGGLVGG